MDNEASGETLEPKQLESEQLESEGPPVRRNVLFMAGGILLTGAATLGVAVFIKDVTATATIAVAGMVITPLAMMAKELLTPEPGPTVQMPASTFERVVSLIAREK